jgi:hypothetical protein
VVAVSLSNSLTFDGQQPVQNQNQNIIGSQFSIYSPENINNIKPSAYKLSSHLSNTNLTMMNNNNMNTHESTGVTNGSMQDSNQNNYLRKPSNLQNGSNVLTPNPNISNITSPVILVNNGPVGGQNNNIEKYDKAMRINKNRGKFFQVLFTFCRYYDWV